MSRLQDRKKKGLGQKDSKKTSFKCISAQLVKMKAGVCS